MRASEFLAAILPPDGYYCLAAFIPGRDKPKHFYGPALEDVTSHIGRLLKSQADVYYAMATYTQRGSRTKERVHALKCLWVDLDVKAKHNASQAAALSALKGFCKTLQLPRPTLVNSGYGIHAYWVLDTAIPYSEWMPYAEGLKAACGKHGIKGDHGLTANAACILRVPGTFNFKQPEAPRKVRIIHWGGETSLGTLAPLLEYTPPEAAMSFLDQAPRYAMDAVTEAMLSRRVSNFKTIMQASAKGKGCAQLAQAFLHRASLEEPIWRAALSIAQVCEDRDVAIHKISIGHPQYSPALTEKKAEATAGPYTCATFDGLNPGLCEMCPHYKKIKSPVQLGLRVLRHEESEEAVSEEALPDTGPIAARPGLQLPTAPFPYFYDKDGGLWMTGEGDKPDELVYPHPYYVVQRMRDELYGDVALIRAHLPQDGIREFTIQMRDVMTKDRFVAAIAPEGVMVLGRKQEALMHFTARSISEMQSAKAAAATRSQFGWNATDSAFLVGDRELTATNVKYSPPSSNTLPLVPIYSEKGDFETWKQVINIYAEDGQQDRALAFFMGFGNVLLKFTPLKGYVMSLYSPGSGTGKTTLLEAVSSIYGHPTDGILLPKDTVNAQLHRVGTLCHIPAVMDEITNLSSKDKSDMVYSVTQGRAKNRMQADVNAERLNKTFWHTGMITTSNKSLISDLMATKRFPSGELARILDIPIETLPHDPTKMREHFAPLRSNYGMAIVPFMNYVVGHLEEVLAFFNKMHAKIERDVQAHNMDRYWVVMVAMAITGGMIAHKLKLHDIDPRPVYKTGIYHIRSMRAKFDNIVEDARDFLSTFLQKHWGDILIVNVGVGRGPMANMVIREPRNNLLVRYEPDAKALYVSAEAFKLACAEASLDPDVALAPYKECGALLGTARKRLSSGTSLEEIVNISVLAFDVEKIPEFNAEALIEGEATHTLG